MPDFTSPLWVRMAHEELGVREIAGPENEKRIMAYAIDARLPYKYANDETAWCAVFVSAILERCGITSRRTWSSLEYRQYGQKLEAPRPGCIVVFNHGGGHGHVGFYIKHSADRSKILVLGGNQANQVSYQWFGVAKVAAYRWPVAYREVPPAVPAPKQEIPDGPSPTAREDILPDTRARVAAPVPRKELDRETASEARDELRENGSRTILGADRIANYSKALLAGLGITSIADVTSSPIFWVAIACVGVAILYEVYRISDARVDDHLNGQRKRSAT